MKTVEQKKKERMPRYITTEEIKRLLNSNEMKNLVEKIKEMEKNTKCVCALCS